jgi:hypothetical protein
MFVTIVAVLTSGLPTKFCPKLNIDALRLIALDAEKLQF